MNIYLHKPGMICSLGATTDEIDARLFNPGESPLCRTDHYSPGKPVPLGMAPEPLPSVMSYANRYHSRNNQILLAALEQITDQIKTSTKHLPRHRVGVVLGSSTSGIAEGERAIMQLEQKGRLPDIFDYRQQEVGAPADFVAQHLQITGPVQTISTACSSGAKALASAMRLIQNNLCDVVICGGADSLCHLTVNGFMALESVSDEPCLPFKQERKGINIGEGACLFIMSRFEPELSGKVCLLGVGETSDAHHISAPDPKAEGAKQAMRRALKMAGLTPKDIDYINLHGTATLQNDKMESLAVNEIFGAEIPCSSTKALTGHTLGAAGAIEAGFCWLTLNQAQDHVSLPPQMGEGEYDPVIAPISLVRPNEKRETPVRCTLSNSFAFGGNNIALVIGNTE